MHSFKSYSTMICLNSFHTQFDSYRITDTHVMVGRYNLFFTFWSFILGSVVGSCLSFLMRFFSCHLTRRWMASATNDSSWWLARWFLKSEIQIQDSYISNWQFLQGLFIIIIIIIIPPFIAPFPKVAKCSENDRKKQQWECKQKPRGKPQLGKAYSINQECLTKSRYLFD